MTDYVNQHFKAFPGRHVRPHILCKSGLKLSVQASEAHYCLPRETGSWPYSCVEVFIITPVRLPKEWRPFRAEKASDNMLFMNVPISLVNVLIEKNGGVAF